MTGKFNQMQQARNAEMVKSTVIVNIGIIMIGIVGIIGTGKMGIDMCIS